MPFKVSGNRKDGKLCIQVGTFLEFYFENAATDKTTDKIMLLISGK
jgi:hypothetical protein